MQNIGFKAQNKIAEYVTISKSVCFSFPMAVLHMVSKASERMGIPIILDPISSMALFKEKKKVLFEG